MLSDVIDQMQAQYRQEGLQEARRIDALRMLRKGYPADEVMEITELSREEVRILSDQLASETEPDRNG